MQNPFNSLFEKQKIAIQSILEKQKMDEKQQEKYIRKMMLGIENEEDLLTDSEISENESVSDFKSRTSYLSVIPGSERSS